MKIILVQIGSILKYPPTISVINALADLDINITVCSTSIPNILLDQYRSKGINVINLPINYEAVHTGIDKVINLLKIKKSVWNEIDKIYNDDTIIWVFSNITLKHLGKKLLKKQYILHLYELFEDIPFTSKVKFLKLNTKRYCKQAKQVIVCEYNRAHITKAWMGLKELPFVLPNKPYIKSDISKNAEISSGKEIGQILGKLKDKKIILYQGLLDQERPLTEFIKAVDRLGDEYAFVIMSGSKNIYSKIKSINYYFIPFIEPPLHLEITSHAFIGILSYIPNMDGYSSPLNALYCAPNKIYEYSMFGIPMIGNDIPGLRYTLEYHKAGVCIENFSEDEIINAIIEIERNYDLYNTNAINFYHHINYKELINKIICKMNGYK